MNSLVQTFINLRLGIMFYSMMLSILLEMEVISSMSLSSSYLKRLRIVMKALFKSSMRKETQVEYLLSITVYS